jgi:hypothetical protein
MMPIVTHKPKINNVIITKEPCQKELPLKPSPMVKHHFDSHHVSVCVYIYIYIYRKSTSIKYRDLFVSNINYFL